MTEKIKGLFSLVLRFGLSGVLLVWLFGKIDLYHMWEAVKGSDWRYMAAAGTLYFGINFLILWRWRILMKAVGLKAGRMLSTRWFFIGLFCNLFLPSSIGGDVVKGLGIAKVTGDKPKVFASVVLDRLIGFAGIAVLSAVAFFFGREIVQDHSVVLAIVFMTGFSLILGTILFSHRIFEFTCRVFSFWPKIQESLMHMHEDILLLRGKQKQLWEAVGISVIAQILLAVEFYLTAKAMHQDISLVYFIIFSPIVCVVTALPSIGGLGVREIGWVYLLSKVGVHEGVALGLSLVNFAFMVVVGLLGGLLYVVTLSPRRVQSDSPGNGVGTGNTRG